MTSAHFNVITDPWIPVVDFEGQRKKMGILDTLIEAHNLKEISDPSPMIEYSLYRFLSVFLMDVYRPETDADLKKILKKGSFSEEIVHNYIDLCEKEGVSFDLFDKNYPFLQAVYDPIYDNELKPVASLDPSIPTGNNHIHFDHRTEENHIFSFEETARYLISVQLFCTAGIQGYPSGVNGAPPFFVLIQRENLFETLLFAMISIERIPMSFDSEPVIWRNKRKIVPKEEVTTVSWLYGMLFPARRIILVPNEGNTAVSMVYYSQGLNYKVTTNWTDPAVPYRITEKGKNSLKPQNSEPVWHNMAVLIDVPGKQAPLVLEQAEKLDRLAPTFNILLFGIETNNMKYISAERYNLILPRTVSENEELIGVIKNNIDIVMKVGYIMKKCFSKSLIPESRITEMVASFNQKCEREFWRITSTEFMNPETDLVAWCNDWNAMVEKYAYEVIYSLEKTIHLSGYSLGKLAMIEKSFIMEIKKIIRR